MLDTGIVCSGAVDREESVDDAPTTCVAVGCGLKEVDPTDSTV